MDEASWPRNKTSEEVRLFLLKNQFLCDVTFKVGPENIQVAAHRVILASRSPVFFAMFCGTLADKENVISIPDIDSDIFKELIWYMYTDMCELSGDNVAFILYAAQKYEIDPLIKHCVEFFKQGLSPDTVCTVLNQGILFNEEDITMACLEYIYENAMDCFESEDFLTLTKHSLKTIFLSDDLHLEEEHVYDFAVRWAKHQCQINGKDDSVQNMREALGDILYTIRFTCMAESNFETLKPPQGLLTNEEFSILYEDLRAGTRRLQGVFTYRNRFFKPADVFARFDKDFGSNFTTTKDKPVALSFSCSEEGYLTGFGLFTPCAPGLLRGSLHLLEGDEEIYHESDPCQEVTLTYTRDHIDEIELNRRIFIKKDVVYTLKLCLQGPVSFYGKNGSEKVNLKGVEVTFYDSVVDESDTGVSEGQIYCLYMYI